MGKTGLLSTLLLIAEAAVAAEEPPAPTDEIVSCTDCHGVQLMGNPDASAPRLSGMESWYVENQLRAFQKGWRGEHEGDAADMEMQRLTDEQIREVSAFVSVTRSDSPPVTIDGDVEKGRAHYSTCAACHGVQAEGNIALGSPALTGLNDWYLVRQLENFRDGSRGGKPGDIYGMQMRSSAGLLPDDQAIKDVVKYISTLEDQH